MTTSILSNLGRLALPGLAFCGLALTAPAQTNLLKNGDFEASKFSIAPWTFSGFAQNIQVDDFATKRSAATKSNAYGATCEGGTLHYLAQKVALLKGKRYILSFDVHASLAGVGWQYTYLTRDTVNCCG